MIQEGDGAMERCPLCGGGPVERLFPVSGGFSVSQCRACRFALTVPPVPADRIGGYYPPAYYGTRNRRFHPVMEWAVRLFRRRRVARIEWFVPKGRVLDIGCGRGITLFQMKEAGWETFGVELSETAATHARALLGDSVQVGDVLTAPWARASFDVVILWHVLEHLPDPVSVVARCRELLRPDGLLVVAVPNFESLQRLAAGRFWFHLDVPRHYGHFGTERLRRLLGEQGFDVREVNHLSLEQNPYGWIQSLLNRLGFPHNLLYDILKHESARGVVHPFRTHPVASTLLVPALAVVGPLALLLTALEALLRRGGTIEVYARCRK